MEFDFQAQLEQAQEEVTSQEAKTEETTAKQTEEGSEVLSEAEQQARAAGWRPKEEYQGDPEKWVDAGEFVRRGQLFEKINHQHREIRELRKAVEGLVDHNRKIEETTKTRLIAELKAAKKMALDEGDTAAAVEIDERIYDAKIELKEAKAQSTAQAAQDIDPAYWDFTQSNPWYTKDRAMTAFADQLGMELAQQGVPLAKVYDTVAKEVRKEFAHKFQRTATPAASVESSDAGKGKTTSKFQPSAEERSMAKMFARMGIMKEDEYYAQLTGGKKS